MNRFAARLSLLALVSIPIVLASGCSSGARRERYVRSAGEYFGRRQYAEALVQYLNAQRLAPNDPVVLRNLGLCYLRTGDPLRAFPYLAKADEVTPDDTEVQLALGAVNLLTGRHAEARRMGTRVLAREPANFDALVLLADASRTPDELADAEKRFGLLKGESRDAARLEVLRGNLCLRQRKLDEAGKAYEAAVALSPGTSYVHQAMAFYYRARGDTGNADRAYRKATELAPPNDSAPLAWAAFKIETGHPDEARRILDDLTRNTPDFIPAWFGLARLTFSEGRHKDAQAMLDRVLKAQPNHFEGRLLQAQIKLAQGAPDEAMRACEALLTQSPNSAPVRYCLAQACLRNGQEEKAVQALRRAVALQPDFLEAAILLAGLDLRDGRATEAVSCLEPLVKQRPGADPAFVLLGAAYRVQKRPEQAETLYRELVRRKDKDPEMHHLLGLSLREQGRKAEARPEFERALELAPDFVRPLAELADMDLQERQYDSALARLRKQAELKPEMHGVHYLIGRVRMAQGNPQEAEQAFLKAIEAEPKFPGPYLALGHLYLAQQKPAEALARLEQNLAIHTNDVASLMLSATIYQRRQDTARARALYEKILVLDRDFVPALNNLAVVLSAAGDIARAHELAAQARRLAATDPFVADTLGWILYQRRDFAWARGLLIESAGQLTGSPDVLYHLGMTHYALGDERSALRCLQQALAKGVDFPGAGEAKRLAAVLALDPDGAAADGVAAAVRDLLARDPANAAALVRQARIDLNAGRADDARRAYEKALATNTNYVPALAGLADILSRRPEDRARAVDYAKRARQMAPDDPRVAAVAAAAASQAGQHRWAASLLEESAKRLPKDALIRYRLGLASYALGATDTARDEVRRALESGLSAAEAEGARRFLECLDLASLAAPTQADLVRANEQLAASPEGLAAHFAAARILRRLGQPGDALKRYEAIAERWPEFSPGIRDLAGLYAGTPDRAGKAYKLAMAARSAMPTDPECATILGRLAHERGDNKWAVQLLKQGTDALGGDADAFFYLGVSYRDLGDRENAARALRRAIEIQPDSARAREARKLLDEQN